MGGSEGLRQAVSDQFEESVLEGQRSRWVGHALNYPAPTDSVACREQLKVLARVTSSSSRLVDSIFTSAEDYNRQTAARQRVPKLGHDKRKSPD